MEALERLEKLADRRPRFIDLMPLALYEVGTCQVDNLAPYHFLIKNRTSCYRSNQSQSISSSFHNGYFHNGLYLVYHIFCFLYSFL